MNLHYSQTLFKSNSFATCVLLPYEFTLLSNYSLKTWQIDVVLLPYEFTLLSNVLMEVIMKKKVLLPYEFTLLSNQ